MNFFSESCGSILTFPRVPRNSISSWFVVLLLISSSLVLSDRRTDMEREKRSFFDIDCKGVYDAGIFARLDRVCEDCYNLFREPQLHSLCRKRCFTTDFFKGCIDVLLIDGDDLEYIKKGIKQLHGAGPLVN